jgi:hypothetical protein
MRTLPTQMIRVLLPFVPLFSKRLWRHAQVLLARYRKAHPTFSDALALVRKDLWAHETYCGSPSATDTVKVPRAFVERLTDAVCYAA